MLSVTIALLLWHYFLDNLVRCHYMTGGRCLYLAKLIVDIAVFGDAFCLGELESNAVDLSHDFAVDIDGEMHRRVFHPMRRRVGQQPLY